MKNISIIFHSGSYDRVNHGLSIALSALLMGGKAKLYFTHASLKYLKREKGKGREYTLLNEDKNYRGRYKMSVENGHVERVEER